MLKVYIKEDGTHVIKGDDHLVKKLPEGYDASKIDISDLRVNVQNLDVLYDKANYAGVYYVERYFALKQAFERQQALIAEERAKPKERHEPAITTASIRGMTS